MIFWQKRFIYLFPTYFSIHTWKKFHYILLFPTFEGGHTCSGRALFTSLPPREAQRGFTGCTAGIRIWWKCLSRNYPQQITATERRQRREDFYWPSTTSGQSWTGTHWLLKLLKKSFWTLLFHPLSSFLPSVSGTESEEGRMGISQLWSEGVVMFER